MLNIMGESKEIDRLVGEFLNRRYLLDMGKLKLATYLKTSEDNILIAKKIAREFTEEEYASSIKKRPVFNSKPEPKNILVIGDSHIPYEHEGYLDFCKEQYDRFNCDTVIHIGDLIDSHATSRHPSLPDAYSPGDELYYTIKKLRPWYKAFPNMKVCIGNHDVRAYKLAAETGLASKWLKGFAEVLETPTWEFEEEFDINGILYTHGTGTSGRTAAITRALNAGQSVVIGHLHTDAGILYHRLKNKTIFGMVVPCGVNENSYGMNYAKNFPRKSVLGCGIVLGDQPIITIMN